MISTPHLYAPVAELRVAHSVVGDATALESERNFGVKASVGAAAAAISNWDGVGATRGIIASIEERPGADAGRARDVDGAGGDRRGGRVGELAEKREEGTHDGGGAARGRGWGFEWRADVPWSRPHLAVISEQPQTGPKKASPLSLADDWRQSRTAHILLFALIAGIIVPGDAATARVMAGNCLAPAGSYNLSQVRRFPCVSSIQLRRGLGVVVRQRSVELR